MLASAVAGVGAGLVANYFADTELTNLVKTRVDPTVDFQWGAGSPDASVPTDFFSARWTGKIQAQFTESYTFYTNSDEGVSLWVNGQQLIDNFSDHTLTEDTGTISLKAGEVYDIRVEYYEQAFDATMQLSWSSPSTAKQIVPSTQLYGDAGWTNGAFLNADVGAPATAGSVSSAGTTFNLNGSGSGTSGTSDQFQYLYQTLQGDGTIVAKVNATQGSSGGAEAGVMIRDSLAANAAYAQMTINAAGVEHFESRLTSGAVATTSNVSGQSGLYWLKLVRDGNFIRGYASATGSGDTWSYFGSANIPIGHTAYIGLTATGGSAVSVNHAQFKNITVIATPPLGAGLDALRDYSLGNVFVDIAKQMRAFQGPNLGPAVTLDSNGWSQQDFMTIFLTGTVNTAHLYNGTYKLSFTGQADLDTWITPGGQIQNKVYNAGTNTTTADIVVNASESADGWYFGMNFRNTRKDAGSALNTGVTNIKMIRPGYAANTTQVFSDLYLQHLSQFSVLRMMDWTGTNNSTVVNWSDRTTPNSARQSSTSGVAWEYVVQMANQLHKDVWVNIPARASDDYVTQLATLLKNTLDPDRVVYLEYSNEVWNGIFGQYADNANATAAEVATGNSVLNADGESNAAYLGWRRTAKRLKEVSDLFKNVWGASAINGRVRAVLAGQFANTLTVQQGLEFIERTYGSPSQFFYSIAEAPYFGFSGLDNSSNSLTVTQILNAMQSSINNKPYQTFDTFARRYGLQNMVYEGGPDTAGGNNIQAKINASLDPRMKDLITSYLNGWYNYGGGLFNWFVTGPTNWTTANGSWGLTNHVENLTAPKIQGTQQVASTPRQSLTYGIAIPGSFDARAIAGASLPYSTTYLKNPGKGKSFDYFIRVPKAGTYSLIFSAGAADSVEQLRVAINSSTNRAVTLANTGSITTFADNVVGNFRLEEGMNLIHVTSVNESGGWNLQTVTIAAPATDGAAPTIASPANATPSTVTTKTTALSILGADDGGEGNLTYSWDALNDQANTVTFSVNGSNAAKNSVATFTRPGTYTLRCTISDGVSTVESSVIVTVAQTATSITVAPSGQAIANGESLQLKATVKDQFGIQMYTQPTVTWDVTNSFGTVAANGVYTSPVSGLGTATVRATLGSITGTATVITQSPAPAETPVNPLPGLYYSYYTGVWTTLPDFSALTPVSSGTINNISYSPATQADNFGLQFIGYINVPASATYTFYTTSDDGSKLWVGGQLVVNNDGKHSATEKSGQIILDAGWHSFRLGYFEATGNNALSWAISGGGLSKQTPADANLVHSDPAPTVATPPSATPNPVAGTTATVSVVGADDTGEANLTYTWSTLIKPSGAANPTFDINGTNASKTATATFYKAGVYQLQVAISDGLATVNATLNITVNSTLTSIQLSPSNPTVRQGNTRQFTATGYDQFGNVLSSQPTYSWSVEVNGGTISQSGLYTAPIDEGTYVVTVASDGVSASTNVTVTIDAAPYIVNAPAATPNPVTSGATSNLSVLGGDDGGEANLSYTWFALTMPEGAPSPTFSINSSNAAKNTLATFYAQGTYRMVVAISDGVTTASSYVDVTIANTGNAAPTVATPAIASPSPVTGSTTNLSALGADDGGETGLTYTWSTTGSPPAAVNFSSNGTNAAKSVTATFTKAGTYNFLVTISDGALTTTSATSVTVNQTLTSIAVAPASTSVVQGAGKQFTATALDQFGTALTSQPSITWSVTSTGTAGTITQAGFYTATSSGTPVDTVRATASSITGTATVTVVAAAPVDIFGNNADIGSPTLAGSASFNGTSYTLQASGADIFGTSDQFHYVYRSFSGDGEIVARVASMTNTHARAKAGVMFRESLAANSRFADVVIAPDNTTSFQYRFSTAQNAATQNLSGSPAPYWVKLTKVGNVYTAFRSPDGVTWTQVGNATTVTMGQNIYVGLALTSHNNAALNTAVFDHASIAFAGGLSGVSLSPALAGGSTGSTSSAWSGLDLGSPKTITQVKFIPATGKASHMVGGKFVASNRADFSQSATLFTLKAAPKSGVWSVVNLASAKAFQFVRYIAADGSMVDVSGVSLLGF